MRSTGGRGGAVSFREGGALASDANLANLDLRSWRVPTLLVGAALACVAAVALAGL